MTVAYEITEQVLTERYTAVVRGEMPAGELATWLAEAFPAVVEYLADAAVEPAGPPFARYTFLDGLVAVEAGFPVLHEVPGAGRVEPSMLPGGPAAVTVHRGRYEDLEHACRAIQQWLANRGRAAAGPHWEFYYTDPTTEPDPARWRTDVVAPYR